MMKLILFFLFVYHLQSQASSQPASILTNSATSSVSTIAGKSSTTIPLTGVINGAIKTINKTITNSSINIPIKVPSPLNDPSYYAFHSAYTPYHALILQQQKCNGKNTTTIKKLAIRQHNTSYYITSEQYFISLKKGNPNPPQLFTAIQNADCSWSFMSKEGLYISLKTAYNYLMLEPSITPTQRFNFKQKSDFLYIQSASSNLYHWTAVNGIGRLAQKQGSRFVIQIWSDVKK